MPPGASNLNLARAATSARALSSARKRQRPEICVNLKLNHGRVILSRFVVAGIDRRSLETEPRGDSARCCLD